MSYFMEVPNSCFRENSGRMVVSIDQLTIKQPCFTPCGLSHALNWMYSVKVTIPYIEITDALAAAHALALSSMVNAVEEKLISMAEHPYTALISLEHACFNATTSTKEKIIEIAVNHLSVFYTLPSFSAILPVSFITLIKAAVNKIGDGVDAANVVRALIGWTTENHGEMKIVLSLLDLIPFRVFTLSDVTRLSKYAESEQLVDLAKAFAHRYKGQIRDDRTVSRCLFMDEPEPSLAADYEEFANMSVLTTF
uniref:BTB domain-containing protein n=1 Tax=Heterorhabditis bacteriophora TaxID=37862 RepID=A0A1I7XJD8_HETBA